MKKVLCVSPHFPPVNAADMHRLRLALPYFSINNWKPTILAVKPEYVELSKDYSLAMGLSNYSSIIRVKAIPYELTKKFGLGNLGLRSLFYLLTEGNKILHQEKFDLIYFSTTVFDSMVLGRYWLAKFKVPFVLDFQDPWRNDFHLSLDVKKRPSKYWFDHRLKSVTESLTVPYASGITAVTQKYIDIIKKRYVSTKNTPTMELTFGADESDFNDARLNEYTNPFFNKEEGVVNIVYTGVVPDGMTFCLKSIFLSLKLNPELEGKVRLYFLGTNYAVGSRVIDRVIPLANDIGINNVFEYARRLPYFQTLKVMKDADILLLPGTSDGDYTASKLFPYVLSRKPILSIFNEESNACKILTRLKSSELIMFNSENTLDDTANEIASLLRGMIENIPYQPKTDWDEFEKYTASNMTKKLTDFFDEILMG